MGTYRVLLGDATSLQPDDPDDLREIVESRFCIPPSDVQIDRFDGNVIDFFMWFAFEARSPAEIRRRTERIIDGCGRHVEVFSVLDGADHVVLTEEELWAQ